MTKSMRSYEFFYAKKLNRTRASIEKFFLLTSDDQKTSVGISIAIKTTYQRRNTLHLQHKITFVIVNYKHLQYKKKKNSKTTKKTRFVTFQIRGHKS